MLAKHWASGSVSSAKVNGRVVIKVPKMQQSLKARHAGQARADEHNLRATALYLAEKLEAIGAPLPSKPWSAASSAFRWARRDGSPSATSTFIVSLPQALALRHPPGKAKP